MSPRNSFKKWLLSIAQVQNADIRNFVKTSERSKILPHRTFQINKRLTPILKTCLIETTVKEAEPKR